MDVGVYTTRDVLDHKKRDGLASKGCFCYWTFFWGLPKGFNDEDFFFVAVEGHWEGLFSNCWTDVINGVPCICFHSEDWHELPAEMKTARKPFQGYTKKVPVIEREGEAASKLGNNADIRKRQIMIQHPRGAIKGELKLSLLTGGSIEKIVKHLIQMEYEENPAWRKLNRQVNDAEKLADAADAVVKKLEKPSDELENRRWALQRELNTLKSGVQAREDKRQIERDRALQRLCTKSASCTKSRPLAQKVGGG